MQIKQDDNNTSNKETSLTSKKIARIRKRSSKESTGKCTIKPAKRPTSHDRSKDKEGVNRSEEDRRIQAVITTVRPTAQ